MEKIASIFIVCNPFTNNLLIDVGWKLTRSELRKFECTECGMMFKTSGFLEKHIRIVHQN